MQITDPIADMLTRIRNAGRAGHDDCRIPASNLKREIARILKDEGYIKDFTEETDNKQGTLVVELKYLEHMKPVISGLKRISKPGLRVYANVDDLPEVLGGLGIAIISTSKGLMTDKQAKAAGIGGEVMAFVW